MSIYTVARDDFVNSARSAVTIALLSAFVLMGGLIFASEISVYDDPFRSLYDLTKATIMVGPILLAPLAYKSVVGDYTSGRLKYIMGLSNSRGEYFAGKAASRLLVVVIASVGSVVAAFLVAALTFTRAPDIGRFVTFAAATLLYLVSFTSIFLAISALTRTRTSAMFASLVAYFLLVPFVLGVAPVVNLETLLIAVGDIFGVTVTDSTVYFIRHLTPWPAYGGVTETIYTGIGEKYESLPDGTGSEIYRTTWFSVVVLLGWSFGPLTLGFLRFKRAELS